MEDGKALGLLLRFLRNPMVLKNYLIQKYFPEEVPELTDDCPAVTDSINSLSETVDKTLDYLAEQGFTMDQLMAALINGPDSLN
ncbi:MAG: hypothetical protein ACOX5A_00530 [Aminivibrio sp.]|nr:hypothetical protein [Synergistaceae bacterium]